MPCLQFRTSVFSPRAQYIVLVTLGVTGLLLLTRASATASDTGQKSPEELVTEVQRQLSERKIHRIEVYYFDWGANMHGGFSKKDLLTRYHYRITVVNHLGNFSNLETALGQLRLRRLRLKPMPWEFQLACVFYSQGEEHLRFFFSADVPVCSINDTLFETDPALLRAITGFLPHEAYEQMYRDVLYQWTHYLRAQLRSQEEDDVARP